MRVLAAALIAVVAAACVPQAPYVRPQMDRPAHERPVMDNRPAMERPAIIIPPPPPMPDFDLDLGEEYAACDKFDPLFIAAAIRWAPLEMKHEYPRWLKAQAFKESTCNPNVCHKTDDSCGLMQHLLGTAIDMGITDRFDPVQSVNGGARYMAWNFGQFRAHDRTPLQRQRIALDAYRRGIGNVLADQQKWACILWEDCFRHYASDLSRRYVDGISAIVGYPLEELS